MILGYVLSRYPLLSETFILRELWELERAGHHVHIYPLRKVGGGPRHARVDALRAPVWFAPWVGLRCHRCFLRRAPGRYLATLGAVVWHNRSDRRLLAGAVAYWHKTVALAERMERDGVEQIHAHYATHPTLAAYAIHRLTGLPYSFTAHAHDLYCHRAMLAHKLERARWAVTISEFNRSYLERAARALPARAPGATPTPVHVVRCGVEWESFAAMAARRWAAPEASGPLRILSVGSLQAYKGHRHLLAACVHLRRQQVRFECVIVGGGKRRAALERQRAALGLEREVRFAGPRTESEVREWLEWAEAFALPSVVDPRSGQMEGIPVALMEAMASGLPVVSSRLSGIPELVEENRTGLLVEPADPRQLAQALRRLTEPELRRRLGRAARARIAEEFDLGANVKRLERLLQSSGRPAGVAA